MLMKMNNFLFRYCVGTAASIAAVIIVFCAPLPFIFKVVIGLLIILSVLFLFILIKSLKSDKESYLRLAQEGKRKDEIITAYRQELKNLNVEIESQEKMLNQLKQEIELNLFPLENKFKPLLELLNDIYIECDDYGEEYAFHLKKRILFNLKIAGYEYIDYNDENIDYYSAFNSNYAEDTVSQPALVNTKTKKCIIRGMVFYKGVSKGNTI